MHYSVLIDSPPQANVHVESKLTCVTVTFGAASILLAASLSPKLDVNLDLDPAKTSWERALHVFEYYKSDVESAGMGIQALKTYRQRFSKSRTKGLQGFLV